MSIKTVCDPSQGISKSDTGTTTNAFVSVMEWICLGYDKKTILIYNSGANSLTYKITVYAYNDSTIGYDFVGSTVLTTLSTSITDLHKTYAKIIVQVKSTVTSTPTTYQIDYVGSL
jgi:hypothetical protein